MSWAQHDLNILFWGLVGQRKVNEKNNGVPLIGLRFYQQSKQFFLSNLFLLSLHKARLKLICHLIESHSLGQAIFHYCKLGLA